MVYGARLESVYTGNRIVGSNPIPSATLLRQGFAGLAKPIKEALNCERGALHSFSEAGLYPYVLCLFA